MVNFYRRFLPHVAATLFPLTEALKGGRSVALIWTPECESAFNSAKNALATAAELSHPVSGAPLSLSTDASSTHVGAALHQVVGGVFQPLSFFSAKLKEPETRYSTFDRELLAIFSALRHFRFTVEGRPVTVYTDHLPLITALGRVRPPWSQRQQRQLSYISEFDVTLTHVPGKSNVTADALSRPPATSALINQVNTATSLPSPSPLVDFAEMAEAQSTCPSIPAMLESGTLVVKQFDLPGCQVLCDVSRSSPRPLVPDKFRMKVFLAVHNLAHVGTRATRRLIGSRFVWSGMNKDIGLWCRQCVACQRAKVHRHASTPISVIPVPELPFSSINIDLVGPLPLSGGQRYLLTIIDRTTRWVEALPLPDASAVTCAAAFVTGWVARHGVPAELHSDRGANFCSSFWRAFCDVLGVKHSTTTSYHPESNGMIERVHRRLKDALRARQVGAGWLAHLPWVLLGIRTAPREISGTSAAQAVFGSSLFLPADFVTREGFGERVVRRLAGEPAEQPVHNRKSSPSLLQELERAAHVFVRTDKVVPPLEPRYTGPFRVISRFPNYFVIDFGTKTDEINLSRLKPAFVALDEPLAVAPRRGRPRKNIN